MDNLRRQILSARKLVQPQDSAQAPLACNQPGSIAPRSNSPFGIYDIKKKGKVAHPQIKQAHSWADSLLRSIAGRQERVVLAVRDAARQAENLGLNPTRDGIYVTSSIRNAWNLKSDQLSKGLRTLEGAGYIRFTDIKKGRHARFLLTPPKPVSIHPSTNIPHQQK